MCLLAAIFRYGGIPLFPGIVGIDISEKAGVPGGAGHGRVKRAAARDTADERIEQGRSCGKSS